MSRYAKAGWPCCARLAGDRTAPPFRHGRWCSGSRNEYPSPVNRPWSLPEGRSGAKTPVEPRRSPPGRATPERNIPQKPCAPPYTWHRPRRRPQASRRAVRRRILDPTARHPSANPSLFLLSNVTAKFPGRQRTEAFKRNRAPARLALTRTPASRRLANPTRHAHFAPSQNPRGLVGPVAVTQQPLVKLSGRKPRQLGLEVDRARHFLARQGLAAKQHQFFRQIRPRQNPRHRLHHCFYFLAKIGVGNAEHGGVRDLGMGNQQILAFLRVDINAARDDHEGRAVGQIEKTVAVDIADVADRAHAAVR